MNTDLVLEDIVKDLEADLEKPVPYELPPNAVQYIRRCRPDTGELEVEMDKVCSAKNKNEVDALEIQSNFEEFILLSRFADTTINNILNYMNGHRAIGYFTNLEEAVKFIGTHKFEQHLTESDVNWKEVLKRKIKESQKGKFVFEREKYKSDCHTADNFEAIIEHLFANKDIKDRNERWIKTIIKGNSVNTSLYQLQGFAQILTKVILRKGPIDLSRYYFISESWQTSWLESVQNKIITNITNLKIKDYKLYNPRYLKQILCVKCPDRKNKLCELKNYYNKKSIPDWMYREKNRLIKEVKREEDNAYRSTLGRKLTGKKITFIVQKLEEKEIFVVKRQMYKRNVYELGKCNPFYLRWKKVWK